MIDACCWACRGALGICLNHRCNHHIQADIQDEADAKSRRTIRDPTAERAIGNVMRARIRNPKRPRI